MRITSLLFGKKTIRTSTHHLGSDYSGMVPLIGLEPIRILLRGILSPLCLPIPPQRRFLCGGRFICERPPFLFRTVFFCVGKSAAKAFEVIFQHAVWRQNIFARFKEQSGVRKTCSNRSIESRRERVRGSFAYRRRNKN